MQTMRLSDGTAWPPALAAHYTAVAVPQGGAGLWLVRDNTSGLRSWLLADAEQEVARVALALRSAPSPHICAPLLIQAEGATPHLTQRWLAETGTAAALASPARERAALQLLDTIHFLQSLPEPVALPGLQLEHVLALPLTGYVRLADMGTAQPGASPGALRDGRTACVAVLRALLAGAGEADHDALAAWENDGAEAYPALRAVLQRLHFAALVADF